jgi:Tfp pilus assembly protein PilZ
VDARVTEPEPALASADTGDADVDYDDIPDDDLVQFSRTGAAIPPASEAGLEFDDDEPVDDDATDPGIGAAGVARLRIHYRRHDAMVREYLVHLEQNGCFIKTSTPLRLGRSCQVEVRAPGLRAPLVIPGVVSWSSHGMARLPPEQDAGMNIAYTLDPDARTELERLLRA